MNDLINAFSAVGGLVGLGSLVAALGAWRKSATAAKQLTPNHGSSLRDAVTRIETAQTKDSQMIRSLGHQVGELHDRLVTVERRE